MKNYRSMKFYKSLTSYLAISYAEGFGEGENATENEQLCAWQYIVDRGLWRSLQGFFGRTAMSLVEDGILKPAK